MDFDRETSPLDRLRELEARVGALEVASLRSALADSGSGPTCPDGTGQSRTPTAGLDLWVVDRLRSDLPGDGGVVFGGAVRTGAGIAQYQWCRTTAITEVEWDDQLERLAAVAHPVRGAILRRLLRGPASVAELVGEAVVSSAGTAYHHVAALTAGGWVAKQPGGRLSIPVGRIVPLLTLITCGEDH